MPTFPAATDAVLGKIAAWWCGFGKPAALIARLAMSAIAGVPARKTIAAAGLAAASFFGALEYQSHYYGFIPKPGAGTTNDSAEDAASFTKWKRSVEQTLEAAQAAYRASRQEEVNSGDSAEARKTNYISQEQAAPPIDLGIAREIARRLANTLKPKNEIDAASDAGTAAELFGDAGATNEDAKQTREPEAISRSSSAEPVQRGRIEKPRRFHPSRHAWSRGRWRRHYAWRYDRVTGVARAYPFVLSVR